MSPQTFTIQYSGTGRIRLVNDEIETDWINRPADGQIVLTITDEKQKEEFVLITLDNYLGDMRGNTVYPIGAPFPTTVEHDVDEEEEDVDGEDEDDVDGEDDSEEDEDANDAEDEDGEDGDGEGDE